MTDVRTLDGVKWDKLDVAHEVLISYMEYETKEGGKEHYNDIIARYREIHASLYSETLNEAKGGNEIAASSIALYADALIETMKVMDQPVYEIYAELRTMFKEVVGECIKLMQGADGAKPVMNAETVETFKGAVLKACAMNVLLDEKYGAGGALWN